LGMLTMMGLRRRHVSYKTGEEVCIWRSQLEYTALARKQVDHREWPVHRPEAGRLVERTNSF